MNLNKRKTSMIKFRTSVEIQGNTRRISPQSGIFLCGSCFSINMGEKFRNAGFNTLYNPFGTLYNPVSILQCLSRIHDEKLFDKNDFFYANNRWQSYELHGDYAGTDFQDILNKINQSIKNSHQFLKEASFAFITLGSAFVFKLIENNTIVANCHKQANQLFHREILSEVIVLETLKGIIKKLKNINPDIEIIFTVSPVRHWRDGAIANQASKSRLISSLYELTQKNKAAYFPSYEIVMDELRDYRFYAEDMLHINTTAQNYIWQKLQECYFDSLGKQFVQETEKIYKDLTHRPLNPNSNEYLKFKDKTRQKIKSLEKKYKTTLSFFNNFENKTG